jgi:hypothetical protein
MPVFSPDPGDRIRIGLQDGSKDYHPLMWLQVSQDNSLYLSIRAKGATSIRKGSKVSIGSTTKFSYQEGSEVTDANERKNPKTSFHGSGLVKEGETRVWGKPLRNLSEQVQLCLLMFRHPKFFPSDPKVGNRDIVLAYPIDEGYPLLGAVFVSPAQSISPVEMPSAIHQVNLVLLFHGLDYGDLAVQVVLHHGVEGPWPPASYMLFWEKK